MSLLAENLKNKLIPWSHQNGGERFIVARPRMSAAQMPAGVQLSRRKISGARTVVKNRRDYSNTRSIRAVWPQAGLNEVNKLKLACVLSGYIDYQLGDYRLQCGAGHFIFIPPGTPHPDGSRLYVDEEKAASCEVLFFLLHPHAVQCWLSRSQRDPGRRMLGNDLVLHESAVALFHTLMKEVISGEDDSPAIGAQLLTVFLAVLQREVEADRLQRVRSNNPQQLSAVETMDPAQADFAAQLEHYIRGNLHKPLTIESVSGEMFLSRAQFTRTVRRETGHSFNDLLLARRLAEAKNLLCDSQWTVAAIASFVGFKSPSHFRTVFRRHTGSTPTAFRTRKSKP
jgi:AraC-like DNA-binding protein